MFRNVKKVTKMTWCDAFATIGIYLSTCNLIASTPPPTYLPKHPQSSLCCLSSTWVWAASVQAAVPSNLASNPLTLLCPSHRWQAKWQRGESEGWMRWRESRGKRKYKRVSASVLLSLGGSVCPAIRRNLFKGEDFSLYACQWESRDREEIFSSFSPLSPGKTKRNNFSFLCSWGAAKPANGRLLITHCLLNKVY